MVSKNNSSDELLDKAKSYVDKFEYDLASKFLVKILTKIDPSNVEALEILGMISNEINDYATAHDCYLRLVEMYKDSVVGKEEATWMKKYDVEKWYSSLAQLSEPDDAVNLYTEAVRISQTRLTCTTTCEDRKMHSQTLASLCCALAEVYVTDKAMHEGADEQAQHWLDLSRQAVQKRNDEDALAAACRPFSLITLEIEYLQAQLLLNQGLKEASIEKLKTCYDQLDVIFDSSNYESTEGMASMNEESGCLNAENYAQDIGDTHMKDIEKKDSETEGQPEYPSVDFLLQLIKLSIELHILDDPIDLLQLMLDIYDDSMPDIYYLLAVCLCLASGVDVMKNDGTSISNSCIDTQELGESLAAAVEALETALKLIEANASDDYQDMRKHVLSLLPVLKNHN